MFDKDMKKALIELKQKLETNYISIFGEGKVWKDNDIYSRDVAQLNSFCSPLDYYIERVIKDLNYLNVKYDTLSFELEYGLIYRKNDLGEDNTILPSSKPLTDRVRIYTGNAYAFDNGELVKTITPEIFGIQGYVDYDKLMKEFKKYDFMVNGPESYEEVKNLILSGQKAMTTSMINLVPTKDIDIEKNSRKRK